MMSKELKNAVNSAICGVVAMIIAFWFWLSLAGNPFDDMALILWGKTTRGSIVDTWEDAESGDAGGTIWAHGATYKYRLRDGREFTQRTEGSGRLKAEFRSLTQPFPVDVEYLPGDPTVSRIKGAGSPNLFDWLWRKVGLGGLLLAAFLSPGYIVLRNALHEFKLYRRMSREPSD